MSVVVKLKEAIRIAEREYKSKVIEMGDCGDSWAFGFEADKDKMDGWILLVEKKSGNMDFVLPAFFAESIIAGKIIYRRIDYSEK